MTESWYWCRTHQRPETAEVCRSLDRLGPYDSPEEARRWKERAEGREENWKAQDEAWEPPKDEWDRQDDEWESR